MYGHMVESTTATLNGITYTFTRPKLAAEASGADKSVVDTNETGRCSTGTAPITIAIFCRTPNNWCRCDMSTARWQRTPAGRRRTMPNTGRRPEIR